VLTRGGLLHPGCAALLFTALARDATATELDVSVDCDLSSAELQELSARVRLLVHGAPAPAPESIAVLCEGSSGSVTLHFTDSARMRSFAGEEQPVERVLAAVEHLLAEQPSREAPTNTAAPTPSVEQQSVQRTPPESSTLGPLVQAAPDPVDAPLTQQPNRAIGGAGLGLSLERWPAPAGFAGGPRLELAWGSGSWAATSLESVRFGSTPNARLLAFDALVGVAWGAPFAATSLGALLAFGGEWFSAAAASDPTGQRTSSTFVVDLGLRWSEPFGAGALWLGAEGRLRARPPELPDPVAARLDRWTVIASVGGALTVR